jgi:hypothetical protein
MKAGAMIRRPTFDPRTVAREIPGLFDAVIPQLTPGVVSALNRDAEDCGCEPISSEDVAACKLQPAMLFELGFAAGEMLISSGSIDWDSCVGRAIERQRRHFDARIPERIPEHDREVALHVGENLAVMLRKLGESPRSGAIVLAPLIPGFQWIASGHGDFAIGETLIEVKCAARNFSAPDYRQIAMYWLLSYANALENNRPEWSDGILLNPRSGTYVAFRFDEFLRIVGAGRTKVDILGLFASMVGTRGGI